MPSRRTVETHVTSGEAIYGVTTGFGKFAQVRIPEAQQRALQVNLLRSHAAGIGPIAGALAIMPAAGASPSMNCVYCTPPISDIGTTSNK